ncbi:MAG: hypothetical protein LBG76_00110 [Treponema sp.]|jgi:hypothetical protein|nr:hypothetical protein [Treponema sp.]
MKKVLFFTVIMAVSAALYAGDHYLTFGLENAFGFRYAEASSGELDEDIIISQETKSYQETNFSIAPGITFFGRFLSDKGIGGFGRVSLLFSVVNYYTISTDESESEGTWTPANNGLMRAFNISGGISGAMPLSQNSNIVADGGLILEGGSAKFREFDFSGIGMVGGLAFQSMLGGLRLELGIRGSVTFGSSSVQNYRITTEDIMLQASPYLTLGIKFGDGIGKYVKKSETTPKELENDRKNNASADSSGAIDAAEYTLAYNGVSRETAYKLSKLWLVETFTEDKLTLTFDDLEMGVIAGRMIVDTGASAYRCNFKIEIDKNKIIFNNFTMADGSRLSQSRAGYFKVRLDDLAENYKKAFN